MRKTLLVAGIGAALITLAGCGGTAVSGSASAPGAGGAAPQGSSSSGQQIKTVADLGAIVQHNTGTKNAAHITMAMNVSGMGAVNATGDVKFGGGQIAEHMTMTLPGMGDMEMVMIGTTSYIKIPSSMAGMPGVNTGKPWTKFDMNSMGAGTNSFGSTANLANQADPTQLISTITQAGTITNVTHDTVDGASTTHYAITVDVQKMIANLGGSNSAAQKQAMSQWGIKTMPFDIWVNSDNLPVKITTDIAMGGMTGSASSQANVTVNYTNWGESVTIAAPPADQVGTFGN
jgi:hypothetical protein